jgi:hypothetical protein
VLDAPLFSYFVVILVVFLLLHALLCSNDLRLILILPLLTEQVCVGLQELGHVALKVQ